MSKQWSTLLGLGTTVAQAELREVQALRGHRFRAVRDLLPRFVRLLSEGVGHSVMLAGPVRGCRFRCVRRDGMEWFEFMATEDGCPFDSLRAGLTEYSLDGAHFILIVLISNAFGPEKIGKSI